ncbi:complex I subunit 5 family protein [Streptacidiphilus jiangxiensis]|uniref:Multicomponent Na+:H+ antiporter subunit D n=1 Tax=Streptacidiphilus jiangxiensis TaxID=235985 RepID=A0A1H7H9A4_STRJI|nr:complex I subunit 5 family protein [Streptacidiphilus jiangxiensis]SEK46367.1 multicomponent Na+:H+ antiporter subunit D [Streptacidiphilus jiangxiensis]
MTAAQLLPLAVAVPLLGAVTLALAGRLLPRLGCDILATAWASADVVLLAGLWHCSSRGTQVNWVGAWKPTGGEGVGIVLVGDRIGIGLALLITVLILAALLYAWRFFEEPPAGHRGTFPALILLFEAGMCGFALTGDLFNAFVFFELMGAVAYALTGYHVEDPRPLQGALTFGVINSLAAYCSLMGIALLYARTGELGMAQIGRHLAGHSADALIVVAFVLVLTGLLVKGAMAPFHFWLPDAHAVAPTPVCMLLSGVMVELGVYGAARVYWTLFSGPGGIPAHAMRDVLTSTGVVTALLGAVMCWQQRHIKRMLAFSTISHVGLFLVGISLLSPQGVTGTALYVAGHAGVKAALFALTGVLLDQHGSVDEHSLYGRARELRRSAGIMFVLGALALAGLPPFGTGLGKALTEHAAGEFLGWLPAVFVLTSAITGATVLRTAARVFTGAGGRPDATAGAQTRGDHEEPEVRDPGRPVPAPMLVVPALLLAGSLVLGLLPGPVTALTRAGQLFTSRAAYLAAVGLAPTNQPAMPVVTPVAPPVVWTGEGIALGLLSTILAAALAATALWGPALQGAAAHRLRGLAAAVTQRLVAPLRSLHSGRLGDNAVWLATGVAVLLVAFSTLVQP